MLDPDNPWHRLALGSPTAAHRPPKGLGLYDLSVGSRHRWQATWAWEGHDWLQALASLKLSGGVRVLGYLSEPPETRQLLAQQAQQLLARRGVAAQVRLRSSYKPFWFWLQEEVLPTLLRLGANHLRVVYPSAKEWGQRFLQEAFPAAALLEQAGITLQSQAGPAEPLRYEVQAFKQQQRVWQGHCFVPLHPHQVLDRQVGVPTGWLEVWQGPKQVGQQRVATDAERFWQWYLALLQELLPTLLGQTPPLFRSLSVRVALSEPEVPLGFGHEQASMLEALAEDIYFATQEACKAQFALSSDSRSLQTGRIVPVVSAALGQEGWAKVDLLAHQPMQLGTSASAVPTPPPLAVTPIALKDLPIAPLNVQQVCAAALHLSQSTPLELHLPAYSYEGRPIVALHTPNPTQPLLLISGGQHANETTGVSAALHLAADLANSGLGLVVLPMENPDGTRLHQALLRLAPHHMHHAARYTALGDDLQARLHAPRYEAAARQWGLNHHPALHLNLHGYPAHEWTRPMSGYAPHGFEAWALPMGILSIVVYDPAQQTLALSLAQSVTAALSQDHQLLELTQQQLRWRSAHTTLQPFELMNGFPVILQQRKGAQLCLISEIPDETVYGPLFALGLRAQRLIGQTAATWLLQNHEHRRL